MSTSTYYNFIDAGTVQHAEGPISIHTTQGAAGNPIVPLSQSTISPASYTTSTSNSSSSLNSQCNSLTPNSTTSSVSSNSSSCASTTNLVNPKAPKMIASARQPSLTSTNQRELEHQETVIPTQNDGRHTPQQMHHCYTLHSLEPKPLRPFRSQSAYIEAMKEDLAEWLNSIYADLELTPSNFFSSLETGAIICRHANNVTQMGRNVMLDGAATSSDSTSSGTGSDNENSLNHESSRQAALSSPSPENDDELQQQLQQHQQQRQQPAPDPTRISNQNQFYLHHRHSTTNSSISSIATSCSSSVASNKRLSLASSLMTTGPDKTIDWFRVRPLTYKANAKSGTFFARDNICQFILWCRSLNVRECLLFETDDLVARKNEKSFILCLLEVARIGFKVGMPTPLIIQFEQEIDREIEIDAKLQKELEEKANLDDTHRHELEAGERKLRNKDDCQHYLSGEDEDSNNNGTTKTAEGHLVAQLKQHREPNYNKLDGNTQPHEDPAKEAGNCDDDEDFGPKPQVITNDLLSLHERVVQLLCQCSCPTQFPMVRIGDGKYKVGDKLIIFVRILRRHIMVRVGGGWQELSEFLRQKDPCRTKSPCQGYLNHLGTPSGLKIATPSPPGTPTPHSLATPPRTMVTSIPVSRSRLLGSGHHLNKGYRNHKHSPNGSRGSISGSASMSWLSHNS